MALLKVLSLPPNTLEILLLSLKQSSHALHQYLWVNSCFSLSPWKKCCLNVELFQREEIKKIKFSDFSVVGEDESRTQEGGLEFSNVQSMDEDYWRCSVAARAVKILLCKDGITDNKQAVMLNPETWHTSNRCNFKSSRKFSGPNKIHLLAECWFLKLYESMAKPFLTHDSFW